MIKLFCEHQVMRKGYNMNYSEDNQLRAKLRFLARLLAKLREKTERHALGLSDFIHPKFYDAFVESVTDIRSQNKQLALTLGHFIKKITLKKKASAIKKGDRMERNDAEDFLAIYDSSWNELVASSTVRLQQKQKLSQQVLLPGTDDLTKFQIYLATEIGRCETQSYTKLVKLVISTLMLFNKRRPFEVAEMTVEDFRLARVNKDDRQEMMDALLPDEKAMADR